MAFFNKYPYTDFHELNADWVIGQTKDLLDRMDTAEATVEGMESRVSTLESQMTTARNNILGLQASVNSLDSRLDTQEGKMESVEAELVEFDQHIDGLEAMNIRDMTVLVPQTGFIPYIDTPTGVKLRLKAQSYAYGNETTNEWYEMDMPMASPQNAGMMYAAEAEKLEALTLEPDVDTIYSGSLYQPTYSASGALYFSHFTAATEGQLLLMNSNGQKALYFQCAEGVIDTQVTDTDDLIIFRLPEEAQPARPYAWDVIALDVDDNVYGRFYFKISGDRTMLYVRFFGSTNITTNKVLDLNGIYLPFM